ncbi:hypothetical protein VE03_06401 [Pseudogymnoascus sp. 23342-1-I1]|nr:hypothetical protein VE03_06401 [Pseudogymnoascus sp. 23342-1-I1]
MLFNTAAALLGLAALVSSAPRPESGLSAHSPGKHLHSRHVQSIDPRAVIVAVGGNDNSGGDRGDRNNGNNRNNRNNNDVNNVIISTTVIQLSDTQRQQEAALIVVIQEQVRQRSGRDFELRKQKDRIRQNHYRNKNQNANTVIIVVTEVVDNRNNDRRSRYMSRQIRADNNQPSDVTVIIADSAITLVAGGNQPKGVAGTAQPTAVVDSAAASASAAALAAIQTVDPNAPFLQTNRTVLAPAGQAFPSFAGVELDPARIVEEGAQGVVASSMLAKEDEVRRVQPNRIKSQPSRLIDEIGQGQEALVDDDESDEDEASSQYGGDGNYGDGSGLTTDEVS